MINSKVVNVDAKLSFNKYDVDEENAHIELTDASDAPDFDAEFEKLVIACPAGLYRRDETGKPSFDYAGCLECGTCRILCADTIIKKWKFPSPTKGVEYRWG